MSKRNILLIVVALFAVLGIVFLEVDMDDNVIIAACPTFYYMIDKLEEEGFDVLKTESTKENIELFEKGDVNMFISGRGVNMDDLLSLTVGPGYIFLFREEVLILEDHMGEIMFFTDLSTEDVLGDFKEIKEENLEKVGRIENYIERGIIITSTLNENKGELVHIISENGERIRLSRVPRLHYSSNVNKREVENVREIVNEL